MNINDEQIGDSAEQRLAWIEEAFTRPVTKEILITFAKAGTMPSIDVLDAFTTLGWGSRQDQLDYINKLAEEL